MCGISGIVNFNNKFVQEEEIRMMMQKMKHRGPDDEGLFIDENIGLGFVDKDFGALDSEFLVEVRARKLKAKVVQLPFYKATVATADATNDAKTEQGEQ